MAVALLSVGCPCHRAWAQTEVAGVEEASAADVGGSVQELDGAIEGAGFDVYRLTGLRSGATLYARAASTSGDLDPILALVGGAVDTQATVQTLAEELRRAWSAGEDIGSALGELGESTTLAWDDDSGGGYAAALTYELATANELQLIVGGALSSAGRAASGGYRLTVGLDSPSVLDGTAAPTGATLAALVRGPSEGGHGIGQVTGQLDGDRPSTFVRVADLRPGDTLYAYAERTSGDLAPVLVLLDYGRKPVAVANLTGRASIARLEYTFARGGSGYVLEIRQGAPDGRTTSGGYRLMAGINAWQAMTGGAAVGGRTVLIPGREVRAGILLQQLVEVDERRGLFTAVGRLRLEWADPDLAFSPDTCHCAQKIYTEGDFARFLTDVNGKWPDFAFENQQAQRGSQDRLAVIRPDGSAFYEEHFAGSFRANLDLRRFPLDVQEFPIRLDMLYPEEYYVLADLPDSSGISPGDGEDELVIGDPATDIASFQAPMGSPASRFTFRFVGRRHLAYYGLRVFVPILLIVLISWVTFFLKDYTRRIEVAVANVLLLVAFGISLSGSYPHLGYLTFLDALMSIAFLANALVVVYIAVLRALEARGTGTRTERIDRVLAWAYPLACLAAVGAAVAVLF